MPSGSTTPDSDRQRRLQQDSIQFGSKTVYLNPFLYWRRFDANTDRWLREPGQLMEEQILTNRARFYPEVNWDLLDKDERDAKDGAVEMFIKSLELISTFNPELTAGQLLEVERKMAVTKKQSFERWVARALKRRLNGVDFPRCDPPGPGAPGLLASDCGGWGLVVGQSAKLSPGDRQSGHPAPSPLIRGPRQVRLAILSQDCRNGH